MAIKVFFLALAVMATAFLVQAQPGDRITPDTSMADGQTLVSAGGTFELGFFSPGDSKNRYLGIWYKNAALEQAVVWVANRDSPLNTSKGLLNLTADGNLIILSDSGSIIWSTGTSGAINPVLQLLDSGNLALNGGAATSLLWQSFDHPGRTLLPGMKIGWDFRRKLEWHLTSWNSASDPSPGDYCLKMDPHVVPEMVILRGSDIISRSGPWNGQGWSGRPDLKTNGLSHITFASNQYEVYVIVKLVQNSVRSWATLNDAGVFQGFIWPKQSNQSSLYLWSTQDTCDSYAYCGANGVCTTNYSPPCECLTGFLPKSPKDWSLRVNSDGCVRRTALNCSSGDGFFALQKVKLPDTRHATLDSSKPLDECRDWCSKNCSCTAYAFIGGIGCLTWTGDLVDLKVFIEGGDDLYVRLASSELDSIRSGSIKKKQATIIIISLLLGFLLVCFGLLLWRKSRRARHGKLTAYESQEKELELPLFDLSMIRAATNGFSIDNKLGEGGFGPVYKGQLADGQEIAVKRLSKDSVQGLDEFKAEVLLISKLQHRNLVRLLGCCIEKEERILVYEYMQNKSLDAFIFDKTKRAQLNWQKRLEIVIGVARGLVYLHRDSRYKIIHRDLKTSNILLDQDMNPKISDFGTARIFKVNQIEENTIKVVGTYGYMSPEYAMNGIFSEKSDVFSFGILLLEILTGKKNRAVEQAELLINHVWRLWEEGRSLELLDEAMGCSYPVSEVLRCNQVGLLCVQECSEDRPTMAEVVTMLGSEAVILPQPKRPGFCVATTFVDKYRSCTNEITITVPEGR